jgi:hypothetical protein
MGLSFPRLERGVDEGLRTVNFVGSDAKQELLCRVSWEALRECACLPEVDARRALELFDRRRLLIELSAIRKYSSGHREADGGILLGPGDLI